MTFGEVCRALREQGYTNLWTLNIWDRKQPPVTMTDEYIAENENRLSYRGTWDLVGNTVIFVVNEARYRIYAAA